MKLDSELIPRKAIDKGVASNKKRIRVVVLVGTVAWLSIVGIGLWRVWGYENAPGVAAAPPKQWPADSRIQPAHDHATLVMLAHPHCPCTRASIGELASIMAHCQGRLGAYVLFLKPDGFSDDWEKSDLWQSAATIPGVTVIPDDDGNEARRFGANIGSNSSL